MGFVSNSVSCINERLKKENKKSQIIDSNVLKRKTKDQLNYFM